MISPTPTAEQIKRARGIAEDWFGPESEGAWAWVLVDGKCLADDIAFALAAEAALALEQAAKMCDDSVSRGEGWKVASQLADCIRGHNWHHPDIDIGLASMPSRCCLRCGTLEESPAAKQVCPGRARSLIPSSAPEKK